VQRCHAKFRGLGACGRLLFGDIGIGLPCPGIFAALLVVSEDSFIVGISTELRACPVVGMVFALQSPAGKDQGGDGDNIIGTYSAIAFSLDDTLLASACATPS
jgi:hypothetical protein